MDKNEKPDPNAAWDLRQLLDSYGEAIFNLCLRMVGNKDDAEDLAQDVLVDLMMQRSKSHRIHDIRAWVMTIAVNTCLDFQRKRKYRKHLTLEEKAVENKSPYSPIDTGPIQEAISCLPERPRALVLLKYQQGFTHEEIAEIMKITPATSRLELSQALAQLRTILHRKQNQ